MTYDSRLFLIFFWTFQQNEDALSEEFSFLKRSELLLILLKAQPELGDIFFDFGTPEKIDLEAFMNQNYKFKVPVERFAYLTGRSLSASNQLK
jgi:hypothetical protein